jgi:hypothetical protein
MLALPPADTERSRRAKPALPFGWIVVGILLLPVTAMLMWANYALLVLGLEAAFGFQRINWEAFGRLFTAEDIVAVVWLLAEVLAGFFLAELLGWVDLLDFDDRLGRRQQRVAAAFVSVLFVALVAGEVGIGLFRQWRIEEDGRLRDAAVRAMAVPDSRPVAPVQGATLDLNQATGEAPTREPSSDLGSGGREGGASGTRTKWTGFVQSLPSAGIALVHTAVPCFTAITGVFVAPLFLFLLGLLLSLAALLPLTLALLPLDIVSAALRGLYFLLLALLRLVAAPARLLIESVLPRG